MMYYRRIVLLSILQEFGKDNKISKLDLQKLLFLFTQNQIKPSYHMIPYNFGCFSFQSYSDLGTLQKYNIVEEEEKNWRKIDDKNYFSLLTENDKIKLLQLKDKFGKFTTDDLIQYVYRNYPYYAINSTVLDKHLNNDEEEIINKYRPKFDNEVLFSIGYEGIHIDEYLNKLIKNNIKLLCDVRKNALSMKYGFSKNQLITALNKLNIKYLHMPVLGINSDKRKNLKTQTDYDLLFEDYENNYLINQKESLIQIINLIKNHKIIALTCFEASYTRCHRSKITKAIQKIPEWKYQIKHI